MPVDVFIVDGARTAFGRVGGSLAESRPDDLAALVVAEAVRRSSVDSSDVDEVILGCANQAGEDNRNVARMAALLAGMPDTVPGYTVNRLCASGLSAVACGAQAIRAYEAELVVAGGVESMSRAPWATARPSKAWAGPTETVDTALGWRFVNPRMRGLDEGRATISLGETAEAVAALDGITREESDDFGLRSQTLAASAASEGWLASDIVEVVGRDTSVATDEAIRTNASLASLESLRPVFAKDGVVTAGTSSPLADGAAAMVLASASAVARHGLTPRGRLLGAASAGVQPSLMGLGPVPATEILLSRLNLTIDDFDVVEINEAFAPQVLACARRLRVEQEKMNAWGGAIALGHPLGASGARLVLTALRRLEVTGGRLGLVTLCVGVGQGVSLVVERVSQEHA
jgi:acetyl-CoA acetyltransferase family protein